MTTWEFFLAKHTSRVQRFVFSFILALCGFLHILFSDIGEIHAVPSSMADTASLWIMTTSVIAGAYVLLSMLVDILQPDYPETAYMVFGKQLCYSQSVLFSLSVGISATAENFVHLSQSMYSIMMFCVFFMTIGLVLADVMIYPYSLKHTYKERKRIYRRMSLPTPIAWGATACLLLPIFLVSASSSITLAKTGLFDVAAFFAVISIWSWYKVNTEFFTHAFSLRPVQVLTNVSLLGLLGIVLFAVL